MAVLCAQYGVARQTGCKWVARVDLEGRRGLAGQSRRPHRVTHTVPRAVREALRRTTRTWPTESNDVWTADFKGDFREGDSRCCYS